MYFCLFDIDGTLLNTGGAGQRSMERALKTAFDCDLTDVHGISTAGRTDRGITADLFNFFNVEDNHENWQLFLNTYLAHLPEHLEDLSGTVLPGIHELMNSLRSRDDVICGLLTGNYSEGARIKLEYYNLDHHFAFGGFGDHQRHRDDVAREALTKAEEHHSEPIDIKRVFVIGDTPADVTCGRAIGANVIAVSTGVFSKEDLAATKPDVLLDDFSDPEALLSLLR